MVMAHDREGSVMSDTNPPAAPPPAPPPAAPTPPHQSMSSLGATTASASSAGGISIVLLWVLSLMHVQMPTEVAIVMAGLMAPILHAVAAKVTKWAGAEEGAA